MFAVGSCAKLDESTKASMDCALLGAVQFDLLRDKHSRWPVVVFDAMSRGTP